VIRGTQTPLEWLDDATVEHVPFVPDAGAPGKTWGATTKGFDGLYSQIIPRIIAALQKLKTATIEAMSFPEQKRPFWPLVSCTPKNLMPENPDLAAAASAIFNAGQIITSAQVVAIFESVEDESMRTLVARLFECAQFQNEALERLRLAVTKLDSKLPAVDA
jgi:hypothetical protein